PAAATSLASSGLPTPAGPSTKIGLLRWLARYTLVAIRRLQMYFCWANLSITSSIESNILPPEPKISPTVAHEKRKDNAKRALRSCAPAVPCSILRCHDVYFGPLLSGLSALSPRGRGEPGRGARAAVRRAGPALARSLGLWRARPARRRHLAGNQRAQCGGGHSEPPYTRPARPAPALPRPPLSRRSQMPLGNHSSTVCHGSTGAAV